MGSARVQVSQEDFVPQKLALLERPQLSALGSWSNDVMRTPSNPSLSPALPLHPPFYSLDSSILFLSLSPHTLSLSHTHTHTHTRTHTHTHRLSRSPPSPYIFLHLTWWSHSAPFPAPLDGGFVQSHPQLSFWPGLNWGNKVAWNRAIQGDGRGRLWSFQSPKRHYIDLNWYNILLIKALALCNMPTERFNIQHTSFFAKTEQCIHGLYLLKHTPLQSKELQRYYY